MKLLKKKERDNKEDSEDNADIERKLKNLELKMEKSTVKKYE